MVTTFTNKTRLKEIESPDIPERMLNIIIDRETVGGYRVVNAIFINGGFERAIEKFRKDLPHIFQDVVQFVDPQTGVTVKGKKYDTTTQEVRGHQIQDKMRSGARQQPPAEETQYEPRDRFQEGNNMSEITKFRNIVKECISEIRKEHDPRLRLKESLRGVVRDVLKEIANVKKPEADKDEIETQRKGYFKNGNERIDKSNDKLQEELETIVHGIDPSWDVYWDDHGQLIVRAHNMLYVRVVPKFENNFDVDAMVKLVDRVRAIALTWEQVKSFIKANFSDLKNKDNNKTIPDKLYRQSMSNHGDREVIKKDAGPESQKIEPRYISPDKPKIKDTKKDDKDYNEPMTKREEDMPDQPMKQSVPAGKDPEWKNKDIKKTDRVKPPKHKNDKKLRVGDKKTPKFSLKQVNP